MIYRKATHCIPYTVICSAMPISKVCCIGVGYVGCPTCSMIAFKCPEIQVNVVDISQPRIDAWNSDNLPIHDGIVRNCETSMRGKSSLCNLCRSSDRTSWFDIHSSVNTPTKTFGVSKGRAPDLKYIDSAARKIAEVTKSPKIVAEKSTVPVKAAESITEHLPHVPFQVLSIQFLVEGTTVRGLLRPDRVLIGGEQSEAGYKAIKELSWI